MQCHIHLNKTLSMNGLCDCNVIKYYDELGVD